MGKMPPPSNSTIAFNKEDLFYALLRLYQLMNAADPSNDVAAVTFEEDQDEEEADELEASPSNYFKKLYAAQHDFLVDMINDYIGLFALLSSPLDTDPKLKKEFIAYAHERGEDIEFTNDTLPSAPKLFIVPPQKDDPNGKNKKPPKK
jgi:hypothetical protein